MNKKKMIKKNRAIFTTGFLGWVGVMLAVVIMFSGCGYKLSGYGVHIPSNIRTIMIPDFENQTTRYQVEQYITFAVRNEFIKRSNLELANSQSSADSMLEGKITAFEVAPVSYDPDASANVYRVTIVISVRFIDLKTDKVIFESEGLSFSEDYDIDPADLNPAGDPNQFSTSDFFAQETGTLKKISDEFAISVVTTILENF